MQTSTTSPLEHSVKIATHLPSSSSKRVLVAEDDPVYGRILLRLLERAAYDVRVANDGLEALALATAPPVPRLLILDWMMPSVQGPEICRRLRSAETTTYQYVLLLTGKDAKTDVIAGLESGADDYLTKPFNSGELLARVQVGMRTLALHDQLLAAQDQLRYQATHDPLTGLWNRMALADLLRAEIERSRRRNDSFFLLMMDLDRFKRINDSYGHVAGDEVLREAARRWTACIRPYDVLCRYGGEEFVLCSTTTDRETAVELAERVREALPRMPIETVAGPVAASVSIGLSIANVSQKCSVESLLRQADEALYRAKAKGRNRVEALDSPPLV